MQTNNEMKLLHDTLTQAQSLGNRLMRARLLNGALLLAVALLLVILPGCANQPPVVQEQAYRPPAELMVPAKTQFLLPENLQRNAR